MYAKAVVETAADEPEDVGDRPRGFGRECLEAKSSSLGLDHHDGGESDLRGSHRIAGQIDSSLAV